MTETSERELLVQFTKEEIKKIKKDLKSFKRIFIYGEHPLHISTEIQ
ncbi:MAG: hypothetical protein ACFFDN_49320 [Candidatus Hodarchaeota archaeon]